MFLSKAYETTAFDDRAATKDLKVLGFLDNYESDSIQDTILILLNKDWITYNGELSPFLYKRFEMLWKRSALKVCTDGALMILHKLNEDLKESGKFFLPDLVSGDFDSVSSKLLQFYQNLGVRLQHTPDQDYTDFVKCVDIISKHFKNIPNNESLKYVVALCGRSERFDHSMSNLDNLFISSTKFDSCVNLFLLTDDSCSTVLCTGKTYLHLDQIYQGASCSLMPLKKPATVTTCGFSYNCTEYLLKIGEKAMNFNQIFDVEGEVSVLTDQSIIFTIQTKTL